MIELQPGTYYQDTRITSDGQADAYITIRGSGADPSECTINGSKEVNGWTRLEANVFFAHQAQSVNTVRQVGGAGRLYHHETLNELLTAGPPLDLGWYQDMGNLDGQGHPQKNRLLYAESKDGVTFTKPNLGIFEVKGTRNNNVILNGPPHLSHNFSPFLDTRPRVPDSERFKALAGNSKSGLIPFISTDGIRWKKLREEPVITKGAFDSQNLAFWSEHEDCYVCYFRRFIQVGSTRFRTIARTTSKDFFKWDEPVEMDWVGCDRRHCRGKFPYHICPLITLIIGQIKAGYYAGFLGATDSSSLR